ncbi:pyridoxamine 5'-phosphate oxidase family protein [Labrys monachus]|uniref:General stress protein 26 n=1 Tax=Labrys monachus TaxID=217067 RepID=A0ABU0FJN2_9HYPH|nr:pyridoxamine 5'-phosphate oxidase family protein [Labrys monachus]MDQ0394293.1 general stress protein 26 [Labrys monachus]
MTQASDLDRVWALAEKIGFCMLSTLSDGEILSRPMAAHAARDENAFYFLTDAQSDKDEEIGDNPAVGLAFADSSGQKYVSIAGRATISNDRDKIRELWSVPMKAWWTGPDDPAIRVLKVVPHSAHYWDSPGTVVSYVKMIAAGLAGTRPAIGDTGTARM